MPGEVTTADQLPSPAAIDGTQSEIPAALAMPDDGEIPDSIEFPDGEEGMSPEDLFYGSAESVVFGDEAIGRDPSFILPSGVTLDVGFETSLVADDNIFLDEEDEEGDVVFRFQPDLAIAFGDGRAKQESYIEVAYRPTANVFFDNDEENSLDQDVSVAIQRRKSKVTVLATAGYRWDLVNALPPMRRTRHRGEATDFLRQLAGPTTDTADH